MAEDAHRTFKDRLYGQFARIGKGLFVHYRLADSTVFELCRALRTVAEKRLAELDRLVREHFGDRSDPEPAPIDELLKRGRKSEVVMLDTRPASECAAGHIAGALSVPVEELQARLRELPRLIVGLRAVRMTETHVPAIRRKPTWPSPAR